MTYKKDSIVDIIENCPVSIRDVIKHYDNNKGVVRHLYGIADRMPWDKLGLGVLVEKNLFYGYGIGLSAYCDDMVDTMIHESYHIYLMGKQIKFDSEYKEECHVEHMTEQFKQIPEIYQAARKRVIYELGKRGY